MFLFFERNLPPPDNCWMVTSSSLLDLQSFDKLKHIRVSFSCCPLQPVVPSFQVIVCAQAFLTMVTPHFQKEVTIKPGHLEIVDKGISFGNRWCIGTWHKANAALSRMKQGVTGSFLERSVSSTNRTFLLRH